MENIKEEIRELKKEVRELRKEVQALKGKDKENSYPVYVDWLNYGWNTV